MRRQPIRALLVALAAVFAFAFPGAAQAGHPAGHNVSLDGTYTLNAAASDNVNAAIDRAVARMNFVTRPIARGRLRRTNQPYQRVVIAHTPQQVRIATDNRAAITTPANGTPVKWRREDGEMFDVSTEWENGKLEQTFKAEDGSRTNVFTVSPDGRTLTMDVTIRSEKLAAPVRYKLVFNRA